MLPSSERFPRSPAPRLASLILVAGLAACSGGGSTSSSSSSNSSGAGAGGDVEPAAMKGMLEAHNAARAAVEPPADPPIPALTWSSAVASVAQDWANRCMFMHSGGQYGENIFATSGTATPADVVADWLSEQSAYDYASNACSDVCGHYTQVVWADSLRLGCGVADCTDNSPFGGGSWQLWVCNYDPPGNFIGNKPY